jgi:hypothetical protein
MIEKQAPEVGRIIKTRKVLTYIMTDLGGTFVQKEVTEDEYNELLCSEG